MNSRKFKHIVHSKKGSTYGANAKISLITVSPIASCNLQNAYLEVWKLVQMHHF